MSREIKFRAWQPESKVMLYGSQYGETNNITTETIVVQDGLPYLLGTRCNGNCWAQHLEDGEAMQYTGLKDKNEKEIYEGDIVRFESVNEITNFITCGEIKYDIKNARFMVYYCRYRKDYVMNINGASGDGSIEIVGNIYEHPDLLSEGKKGE